VITPVSGFIELVTVCYDENLRTIITIHHPPQNSIKLH